MSSAAPASPPARTFTIRYEETGQPPPSRQLRGEGKLTIDPISGRVSLAGVRPGGWFQSAGRFEQQFAAAEIARAVVDERRLTIELVPPSAGSVREPIIVFASSAEEAAVIAALVPTNSSFITTAEPGFETEARDLMRRSRGMLTNVLIGLNVVVFVAAGVSGAGWLEPTGTAEVYLRGANSVAATSHGEWWRLVTSMFLHYGVVHVMLNMWALLQAGHMLEALMGRRLFAVTYFGAGIIGSLASLHFRSGIGFSAGASGAVCGVYGALLGYFLRERASVPKHTFRPMMQSSFFFAAYNLAYGFIHPGIDNAAHIGGFLGGLLLGWLGALPTAPARRQELAATRFTTAAAVAIGLAAIGAVFAPKRTFHIVDEVRWETVNRDRTQRELELLEEQQQHVREARGGGTATLVAWLNGTGLPFYEDWRRALESVPVTPGLETAARKVFLLEFMKGKSENYRTLAQDLEARDPGAIPRFEIKETELLKRLQAQVAEHAKATRAAGSER